MSAPETEALKCPECGEEIWDLPCGSKLAKCWNTEGHETRWTLAFDTMGDDDECTCSPTSYLRGCPEHDTEAWLFGVGR